MPRVAWPGAPEEDCNGASQQESAHLHGDEPLMSPSVMTAVAQESIAAMRHALPDSGMDVDSELEADRLAGNISVDRNAACPVFCSCAKCRPALVSFASFASFNNEHPSSSTGFGALPFGLSASTTQQPASTSVESAVPSNHDPPKDGQQHRKRMDGDATDEVRRSERIRIKTEAMRSQPWRNGRHKAGFYHEQNLITLAWRGSGTKADPLVLF